MNMFSPFEAETLLCESKYLHSQGVTNYCIFLAAVCLLEVESQDLPSSPLPISASPSIETAFYRSPLNVFAVALVCKVASGLTFILSSDPVVSSLALNAECFLPNKDACFRAAVLVHDMPLCHASD